jgi:histidine triad (HIT) family protein
VTDCLFCRIVRGEIPATLVAEDAECVAFRDIQPQAEVHVLVIPKQHVGSMNDVTDASVVGAMSLLAKEVAAKEGVDASGYRCVINTGRHGGQSVDHIHLHLLGGRQMGWPPG